MSARAFGHLKPPAPRCELRSKRDLVIVLSNQVHQPGERAHQGFQPGFHDGDHVPASKLFQL
jgi:hypothetical protein